MSGPARALWLVLLALGACGGTYKTRTDLAKRTFWELRSPDFIVRTDLDRDDAEAVMRDVETKYLALLQTYRLLSTGREPPPGDVAEILLFKRCADVRDIDERLAGFVTSTPDFRGARLMVTCSEDRFSAQVLIHELAHLLNIWFFGPMPVWLQEGLATYVQSIRVEKGQIDLGHPGMEELMISWQEVTLPQLDMVLTADNDRFYGANASRYYFVARQLVHLLNNSSEDYHRRFQAYLRLLAEGKNAGAFETAFAGVPMTKLADELRDYHKKPGARVWHLPYAAAPESGKFDARKLGRAEVHAQWIQAMLVGARRKGGDPAPLLPQVETAAREDPSWADAALWKAVIRVAKPKATAEDRAAALVLLEEQLERKPGDERALSGIVTLQTEAAQEGTTGTPAERLAAFEKRVLELARVASTASSLNAVAWYFALRGKPAVGLGFARRSVEAEPGCAGCLDTLALLLFQSGRVDDAVSAQERAVQMAAERGTPPPMRERLAEYQRARDRCKTSPADCAKP